jgi:hypothetical protein
MSSMGSLKSLPLPEGLKRVLLSDKTDELPYITGKYYCHNFASQFFLQNSSLVTTMDAFDLSAITSEWGTIISRLADSEKLPVYYVSLSNTEHGFYHAINAYLVNPEKPKEIESYIFIEPQTDETFLLAFNLYNRYRNYYDKSADIEEVVHVSIGTFDAFKSNGNIFQSWTSSLYTFDIKYK